MAEVQIKESDVTKRNKPIYFFIKRLFDILIAIIGLIIMIPLSIIIKIGYLLCGDTKTIFYKQDRIGKNGKHISIFKYRTMVPNADKMLEELLKDPKLKEEWDSDQKLKNDPRITKVGRLLRRTSLDEIPQFINVLIGDMSFVGPRPLVEGELDAHGGDHELYESVRPGITGWWAVNGRSVTSYEERLSLEYTYCKKCSVLFDLKCIFKTICAVISRRGAK